MTVLGIVLVTVIGAVLWDALVGADTEHEEIIEEEDEEEEDDFVVIARIRLLIRFPHDKKQCEVSRSIDYDEDGGEITSVDSE